MAQTGKDNTDGVDNSGMPIARGERAEFRMLEKLVG